MIQQRINKIISRILSIITLIVSLNSNTAYARITSTYSVDSRRMTELSDEIDKETMVFITLEDTLYMSKSKMLRRNSPYRSFLNNMFAMGERYPKYLTSLASWYGQRQVILSEEEWPSGIDGEEATK